MFCSCQVYKFNIIVCRFYAVAAATATGNDAITFNAANFNFSNYGLVNIKFADRTISLTIGKPEIIINGETKEFDVAPIIRNERTFLPLRACAEVIGKEEFYSKGLILVSDIPDILHEILVVERSVYEG